MCCQLGQKPLAVRLELARRPVYIQDGCRRYFEQDLTVFSFIRQIGMSRRTFTSSARNCTPSSGSNLFASRRAAVSEDLRLTDCGSWWKKTRVSFSGDGMNISRTELRPAQAEAVQVTEDSLVVDLADGRTVSVPIAWYPRLAHGTMAERSNWRLIGHGDGIHWPDLDEDISIESLLAGRPSGESQSSLKRWLRSREVSG